MGGGRGGVGVLSNFCASAPHSHSFSSLLTTSLLLIYDSFMHYHSKFLGERNVSIQRESLSAKMKKIPEQNTRDLFPALLLLYLVQLLHFWLEQSFSLSITISVGKQFPNLRACARGRGEGWCAGVSGWVLDSGCECVQLCVCPHQGVVLPFLGDAVISAFPGGCGHCSAGRC